MLETFGIITFPLGSQRMYFHVSLLLIPCPGDSVIVLACLPAGYSIVTPQASGLSYKKSPGYAVKVIILNVFVGYIQDREFI